MISVWEKVYIRTEIARELSELPLSLNEFSDKDIIKLHSLIQKAKEIYQ